MRQRRGSDSRHQRRTNAGPGVISSLLPCDGSNRSRPTLRRCVMHIRRVAGGVLAALMIVVPASASVGASPGANGRIAFEQGGVIYSIRADGTDRRQLTAG